jgi:hypothetical protein
MGQEMSQGLISQEENAGTGMPTVANAETPIVANAETPIVANAETPIVANAESETVIMQPVVPIVVPSVGPSVMPSVGPSVGPSVMPKSESNDEPKGGFDNGQFISTDNINAQISRCKASLERVSNNLTAMQEENMLLNKSLSSTSESGEMYKMNLAKAEETINNLKIQLGQQEQLVAKDMVTIQESKNKITSIEEQLTKVNKSLKNADMINNNLAISLKKSEEMLVDEEADDKKYKIAIGVIACCLLLFIGLSIYLKMSSNSDGGYDGSPHSLPMIGGSMSGNSPDFTNYF